MISVSRMWSGGQKHLFSFFLIPCCQCGFKAREVLVLTQNYRGRMKANSGSVQSSVVFWWIGTSHCSGRLDGCSPSASLIALVLTKALCASKISRCVGILLAQGSAGAGHTAKRGTVFSECFFWCCIQCRRL